MAKAIPKPVASLRVLFAAIFAVAASAAPAAAEEDTPSFAGGTVRLIIAYGTGGGYDQWARLVGRYIGRHVPGNPTVIPENKPGAGGYVATSYLYAVAPNDGTVFGLIGRDTPLGPITNASGARFEPLKMSWLGTPTTETNVCIAMKTSKVHSVQDLFTTALVVGDVGPGSGTRSYPLALNKLLRTKFKLVSGYPSSSDVFLAMERGEVEGICESLDSIEDRRPNWIASGEVNILFQGAPEPDPSIKAPFVIDLAKTQHEKDALRFLYAGQGIGRPFVAPPRVPARTLAMLRDAFSATMRDPDFIADAARQKFHLRPHDGDYLNRLIAQIYSTPQPLVAEVAGMINQ
jgi:tripartite-type tricarboxylate transporter receptor subunit TctC